MALSVVCRSNQERSGVKRRPVVFKKGVNITVKGASLLRGQNNTVRNGDVVVSFNEEGTMMKVQIGPEGGGLSIMIAKARIYEGAFSEDAHKGRIDYWVPLEPNTQKAIRA